MQLLNTAVERGSQLRGPCKVSLLEGLDAGSHLALNIFLALEQSDEAFKLTSVHDENILSVFGEVLVDAVAGLGLAGLVVIFQSIALRVPTLLCLQCSC